jgi:16S rRNA (guanine966-N2)-methyltransferase
VARSAAINTHNGLSRTNHRRSLPDVRVVAGDLRGRRIEAPVTDATRPTTDKVREAVFNALGSLGVVEGARIVDLFAGTGAMGIEALSRGAAHCVFVEKDRAALTVLRSNLKNLDLESRTAVISADAVNVAAQQRDVDVLIADPPYGFNDWAALLEDVEAGLVVLESDRPVGEISGWDTVREKKYGRTFVAFLQRAEGPGGTVEGE